MGTSKLKPIKIKLTNNTASSMYIMLYESEIHYTKDGETKPPNRKYKIQIEVEIIYNNKRCRGKRLFTIAKGTSIGKAVASLLGKREEIKDTLRTKGTLKVEKKILKQIDSKNRIFKNLFEDWINRKSIEVSASTVRMYNGSYRQAISKSKLANMVIDDITENDIQNVINTQITKGIKPKTIAIIKVIIKPLLELNDIHLNWRKIILPKIEAKEKYSGTDEEARLIAKTLLEYSHPIARGVFAFLLSGRRIGETMLMEHKHINYENNTFTLPKENTKTHTTVTYELTPLLLNAIKLQRTTTGKIFNLKPISIHYHWKKAMRSIGINNMVMHDLRSMVAVVALRNGADIYSVSKMLSHKLLSTTQANYLNNDTKQALEAQNTFTAVIGSQNEIIDVEIEEDEFTALKKIYPYAPDHKIYQIIKMMK